MTRQGRPVWAVCAILALALAVRLAAGVWWQSRLPPGQRFGFGDSESYWVLGQTIARGEPYEYGADNRIFRTPGYPALLATLFWFVGDDNPNVMWVRLLSALCGTAAVGGVMILARQWFSPPAALAAGAVAALHPEAIALGTFALSEAPFCPLMLAQLVAWQAAWKAGESSAPPSCNSSVAAAATTAPAPSWRTWAWSALAGAAAALATLMRPSWLLFTPFALSLTIVLSPQRRRHLAIGVPMLLALALVMTPWWWRNYQITGRFVLTTLQVGASLYDGLSPTATGASDMRFVADAIAEQRAIDAASPTPPRGTFEERLDRHLRDQAVSWARQHPSDAARLVATKFLRMWNVWPNAGEMGGWATRILIACGYVPLMLAVAWTFAKRLASPWASALAVLPAIYFTSLHVIFVSSIRYRQPALLPLIAFAAGGVFTVWQAQTQRTRSEVSHGHL